MRFSALLGLLAYLPALGAGNWPQWRGPALNGFSEEAGTPVSWTTTENVTWKLAMPARSGSTPIIWGEKIFLNMAEGGGKLSLWCVDRNNGQPIWKRALGEGDHMMRKQNMSSPSPVTDGRSVWVMTGTGVLKAFDFDGKELWSRDVQNEYGQFGLNWGYASSPLLHEDSLIVQVLHGMRTDEPSYVLRISKATGKTIWRVERPTTAISESPDSYSTPQLLKTGKDIQIVISGGDYVTGHDFTTGKEIWRGGGLNPDNNPFYRTIASSVIGDGLIYVPTRVKPLIAYRTGGRGDITQSHKAWEFQNGPDVPTPVSDGKYLYSINDRGIVWCLDAKTGAEVYGGQRLKPAIYSASPVIADGKIYITSEEGSTSVIRTGPKFEVLAVNETNEYTLSSVAVSEGQIFLRTQGHLYCIGQRKNK